jgi:MarR family transcriptional regulator, organic hydroperoxide resistance regulator
MKSRQKAKRAPELASNRTMVELKALRSLRTVFGSARTHDAQVRKTAGVSGSQLWALSEIAQRRRGDELTVNGLSVRMALHQTTTSNLVNVLVERGLIQRQRGAADQRVVHLRVTTEGKQLLLVTPQPHAGLLVDALRNLEATQLHQLSLCLEWVVKQMRETSVTASGETLMGE